VKYREREGIRQRHSPRKCNGGKCIRRGDAGKRGGGGNACAASV